MFEQHDLFWFMACVFCHIIDDFYLQGILADLKQKKFWAEHAPYHKYRNDYKVALLVHGLSWSFMIQIPLWIRNWETCSYYWCISAFMLWIINANIHMFIDNLKANKLKINLVTDQLAHAIQIILTFVILTYCHL